MDGVSAVLIVRDEAAVLRDCLAALEGVVDEIVVVDTGSRDRSASIAADYTDRILDFPWADDFAAARNFALDQARHPWALVVDADESLDNRDETRALLERFTAAHGPAVVGEIEIVNQIGRGLEAREVVDHTGRFFSRAHYRYAGAIHEQLVPCAGAKRAAFTGVRVLHGGYAQDPGDPAHKAHRNLRLLADALAADPADEYLHFQAGKAHFSLRHWDEAAAAFERALAGIRFDHAAPPQGKLGPVSRKVLTDLITSLAYAYANLGRLADADALLAYHGALHHPGTARADFWYTLGYVRLMQGAIAPARNAYELALELGPDTEDVRGTGSHAAAFQMGLLREAERDLPGALEWYRRALAMRPDYAPALSRCVDFITEYRSNPPATVWAAADPRALGHLLDTRVRDAIHRHDLSAAGLLARAAAGIAPDIGARCRAHLDALHRDPPPA
jgi:glycosyltransferase involved in cell wall biosynthesis